MNTDASAEVWAASRYGAPSRAWSSRGIVCWIQVWKPNARTARAWIQNAPGSLSSVLVPAGSDAR
jgi:hypothetical protein